jgi:hypothetical protein
MNWMAEQRTHPSDNCDRDHGARDDANSRQARDGMRMNSSSVPRDVEQLPPTGATNDARDQQDHSAKRDDEFRQALHNCHIRRHTVSDRPLTPQSLARA